MRRISRSHDRLRLAVVATILTTLVTVTGVGTTPAVADGTTGAFTGDVVDASGAPLSDAWVITWRKGGANTLTTWVYGRQTTTDVNGHFKIAAKPGQFLVEVVPDRTAMFTYYYYATLVGDTGRATNDYQPAPGSGVAMYDLPVVASHPTLTMGSQVVDLATTKLRQGGMVQGRMDCPGIADDSGSGLAKMASGDTLFQNFDFHKSGNYTSSTPWPVGPAQIEFTMNNCPYGGRGDWGEYDYVAKPTIKPATTLTLPTVNKRPPVPSVKPHVVGSYRAGTYLTLNLGTWPAGTHVRVNWVTPDGWRYRTRIWLPRAWRGKTVACYLLAQQSGHFVARIGIPKRLVR